MRQSHQPNTLPPKHDGVVLAYDIETTAPEMPDGSFPPWPGHRPIAIGFAQAERHCGDWSFRLDALVLGGDVDEDALLREADRRIGQADVVATYNGRQFDALVLRLSAQRRRLFELKALANHAAAHRFGDEHADLADLYASYGRKVSLGEICDALGVPAKTSVSGADVGTLWEAGETTRIQDYVLEDAVGTLVMHLAFFAARHADEALITRPLAALARHIEATPDLAFLEPFVDCALTRWTRPRAMKADIAAALRATQDRLKREEQQRAFIRPEPQPIV